MQEEIENPDLDTCENEGSPLHAAFNTIAGTAAGFFAPLLLSVTAEDAIRCKGEDKKSALKISGLCAAFFATNVAIGSHIVGEISAHGYMISSVITGAIAGAALHFWPKLSPFEQS